MKKTSIFLVALLAMAVSCNKETAVENNPEQSIHSISATIVDEGAKTTYTDAGVFSWISGDKISYMVRNTGNNVYDRYQYSTTGSGAAATFTGDIPSASYAPVDYAFYPYNGESGYTNNTLDKVSSTTFQAKLSGTIKAYDDRLKGIVPMIGKKTGSDASGTVENYHFYPVTGLLKISMTGIPATASQIRLTVPDAATYPMNGNFNIDTERAIPEIKATDVATGYADKWLNFDYKSTTDAFYIPLPTGTIPAGALTVALTDGTNILYSVTNKQDIVLTRGEITALPSISIPSIKVKISGSANDPKATFYFSGDVASIRYANNMRALGVTDSDTKVSTSGTIVPLRHDYNYKWPLQFRMYNSSDERIGELQTVYYYSVNSTGESEVCKQFTSATTDIGLNGGKIPGALTNNAPFSATTPTITFAVSDDASKGSIMVTEFCGVAGKVYASYVDYYDSGSGTPKQGTPQIITNNEVFCSEGGNDYVLKEGAYASARFGVKTTVYGTPSVYDQSADLVCWGQNVGLYSSVAGWGPYVEWFYDPE